MAPAGWLGPLRHGIARRACIVLAAGLLPLVGPGGSPAGPAAARDAPAADEQRVSVSGWLHLIWNGAPRAILVDDRGAAVRLVIDEALVKPFGGLRAIAGRRVTVTGERLREPADAVRVEAIQLGAEGR